ncbi:Gfo/Idh/MocA family protein [Streptomyces sp. NPDC056796]|uniref:Gfo/Idh/MocA family protein n=1 Tax=Streptomyces sp. NPDC056796 TaxID=3345947 RepID=UPI00367AC250
MTTHSDAARPLRIGLAGAGPWARLTHAPALAAHPRAVLSGVWARRPEAADALAAGHGTASYTGDAGFDELLAVSDAVAFAVPPDVQAPLAARAADAGCHLLLDKPVATTVAGARETADAAARARVASVVFCTLRFAPGTAGWIAEQAAAGGWFTARASWIGALFAPGTSSEFASPWRREKGGLWDVGPHALSVLIPVLGDVTEVVAASGPADTTHLLLRHTSGASSTVTLALDAPPGAAGTEVEFRGEHGVTALPPGGGDAAAAFRAAVDALAESARTGVAHPCDVRFGLRLTEILARAGDLGARARP